MTCSDMSWSFSLVDVLLSVCKCVNKFILKKKNTGFFSPRKYLAMCKLSSWENLTLQAVLRGSKYYRNYNDRFQFMQVAAESAQAPCL